MKKENVIMKLNTLYTNLEKKTEQQLKREIEIKLISQQGENVS